jgi:hypothetical protein
MTDIATERYLKKVGAAFPEKFQLGVDAGAATIYENTMVTALTATGMAVKAGVASAGPVLGVAEFNVTGGSVDGDRSVTLMQGLFWFGNSASTDEITAAEVGKKVYVVDNQTVAKTSNSGARRVAGVCLNVDSELGVQILINAALNAALDADQSDSLASFQAGAATLVAGTVTVATGITVSADSEVIPIAIGAITGSTNFGSLRELKASRVNGAPGVGTIVLEAVGADGAKDVDAAGAIRFVILTPLFS